MEGFLQSRYRRLLNSRAILRTYYYPLFADGYGVKRCRCILQRCAVSADELSLIESSKALSDCYPLRVKCVWSRIGSRLPYP